MKASMAISLMQPAVEKLAGGGSNQWLGSVIWPKING